MDDEAFAETGEPAIGIKTEGDLRALRAWLQSGDGSDVCQGAVLMDATTLLTATTLIRDEEAVYLTAPTLFDLATFATNLVLNDRIVVLKNPHLDRDFLARCAGDEAAFVQLPDPYSAGVSDVLRELWSDTSLYLSELRDAASSGGLIEAELTAVRRGWELVLGRPVGVDELFCDWADRPVAASPPYLFEGVAKATMPDFNRLLGSSDPSIFLGIAPASSHGQRLDNDQREVIEECNHRSYFNERTSRMLQLPYAPSVARLPFRAHLYARARAIHQEMASVRFLEGEYRQLAAAYHVPGSTELVLPVFLAAALSRTSSLEQLPHVLAELRAAAAPFRRHRADIDRAVEAKAHDELARLRGALQTDAARLRDALGWAPAMGGIGALVAAVATGPAPVILAGLCVLAGGAQHIAPETRQKLVWRLCRPQYHFLADVGASARAMTNAMGKVEALWNLGHAKSQFLGLRLAAFEELQHA